MTHEGGQGFWIILGSDKSSGITPWGWTGFTPPWTLAAGPSLLSAEVESQASTCHFGFLPPAPGPCLPAGWVSKAPRAPNFPAGLLLPGRTRMRRKASQEPCPSTPHPMIHIAILTLGTRTEVMQHDRGWGWEQGTVPNLCHRGSCRHEGGGPSKARDERAAGGPQRMQGLRMQPRLLARQAALGSSLLHCNLLSCLGDTRSWGLLRFRNALIRSPPCPPKNRIHTVTDSQFTSVSPYIRGGPPGWSP